MNKHFKTVGMAVLSQGKPTSNDLVKEMTGRFAAAVKANVPAKDRLAFRMAVRGMVKQLQSAAKGI